MTKTILIITEDCNIKKSLERKLQNQLEYISIKSNPTETDVQLENKRIKIITDGVNYDRFIYDEIKYITKEALLAEMLDIEEDIIVEDLLDELEKEKGLIVKNSKGEVAMEFKSNGETKINEDACSWSVSKESKVQEILNDEFNTAKDAIEGGIDYTDTFNKAFQSAEQFSKSLIKVLESYVEFAKEGNK